LVVSLLLASLSYVSSQQYTTLPLTLYRSTYGSEGPGLAEYFAVTVCDDSCAGNQWAVLSIALPSNPEWKKNQPFIVVELSKCKYSFDASCVFATNYFWNIEYFPQVIWQWRNYLDASGTFYVRVTAPISTVTYSFDIQFQPSGSPKSGVYDYYAFRGSQVPSNTVYNRLSQMVRLQESSEVRNFDTDVYFLHFCVADFPSNCDRNAFRVVASVVATADRPMSQFNLYGCPWETGPGCGTLQYTVADRTTISIAQIALTNNQNQFNATDGMYLSIYGLGGEQDQINGYMLSVKLYLP